MSRLLNKLREIVLLRNVLILGIFILFNHEEHFYPSCKVFLNRIQGKSVKLYIVIIFYFKKVLEKIVKNTALSTFCLKALFSNAVSFAIWLNLLVLPT